MAKNKLSKIIYAVSPVFLGLAILWNQAAGNLYDNYIAIGAIIYAITGVVIQSLK